MKKILTIICIFLVTLFACKKEVSEESPEFIGQWTSEWFGDNNIAFLTVDENSNATYQMTLEGSSRKEYKGTARANNKHFKIGRTNYFDIIEYPHPIDTSVEKYECYDHSTGTYKHANWKMILEGMKPAAFHACERLEYYKADY